MTQSSNLDSFLINQLQQGTITDAELLLRAIDKLDSAKILAVPLLNLTLKNLSKLDSPNLLYKVLSLEDNVQVDIVAKLLLSEIEIYHNLGLALLPQVPDCRLKCILQLIFTNDLKLDDLQHKFGPKYEKFLNKITGE